ncbi:isochorismatase family protein [Frondihabitans cladoniiphilus]|uniref:Isochorismatase family protein n=1 Tax=Frondihabitans cladoniiphilus TaxID=715785 RepID=A0ABP8W443_9MICO
MTTVFPWEGVVPADEIALHERRQGPVVRPLAVGSSPAIIVVDMSREFVDSAYPTGDSEAGGPAVAATLPLLAAARAAGVPIVYTRQIMQETTVAGIVGPRRYEIDGAAPLTDPSLPDGSEVADAFEARPDELQLMKTKPSGFHATPLLEFLTFHRIDTLIVTGMVTSGCVRATALDGYMNNFNVVLPHDATADWSPFQHATSLFDLHMKYADVTDVATVVEYLGSLPR